MNWTLPKACAEFGVSRDTIKRGLINIGEVFKPGKAWPTRTIVRAIYTDGKTERARLTRAQADREELEVAQLRRELVTMTEVTALLRAALQPVRDGLVNMPASLAVRCNPSDPPMAMAALREGVDNMLRGLRDEEMPKVLDAGNEERTDGNDQERNQHRVRNTGAEADIECATWKAAAENEEQQ